MRADEGDMWYVISFLAGGLIAAVMEAIGQFGFDGKITLGESINAISTIAAALVVAKFLDRENNRRERLADVYFRRIERCETAFLQISGLLKQKEIQYLEIVSLFKSASISLKGLKDFAKAQNFKELDVSITIAIGALKELKEIVTDQREDGAEIRGNVMRIDPSFAAKLAQKTIDVENAFGQMQVAAVSA